MKVLKLYPRMILTSSQIKELNVKARTNFLVYEVLQRLNNQRGNK